MSIKLELLKASYWEHYKAAKDLAMILPVEHPKRKKMEKTVNDLSEEIQNLKKEN